MSIKEQVIEIAEKAKEAASTLAKISSRVKDKALLEMADELIKNMDYLTTENAKDLDYAQKKGLSKAMIDRLTLDESTIKGMAEGLKEVAALPDPVG